MQANTPPSWNKPRTFQTSTCTGRVNIEAEACRQIQKDIFWTGLRTKPDFVALGLALQENSGHLEALELDFIDWDLVKKHWDDLGNDVGDVFKSALRVRPCSTKLRFPTLQKRSLSGLDLTSSFRGIASALNPVSLRSIALRRCSGWELLLEHLTGPSHSLSITSLEVYQPFGIASLPRNHKLEHSRTTHEYGITRVFGVLVTGESGGVILCESRCKEPQAPINDGHTTQYNACLP
ncbi:hypothetical protein VFPPC_12339 [Pochonia chlamydosporia 170]|uniref:Uncharacterized protein n=1 Tax=Pochonia chlamydosporia 170 TaxID=1380566 RepID=A0A179EWK4_METCM|nr:hypothetical protein VFPPC_12339 [Pochonia chlamydosporia 170]OAQ57558.2 hypothetical protein VFPPC_12339 [Pochonia chlamydosporia 170]